MTSSSLFSWLALGAIGYVVFERVKASSNEVTDSAVVGKPEPLWAGVPYLFMLRLEATEAVARPVLESKGVEMLVFAPATVTPFWAKPGDVIGTTVASFRAVPHGNSTITLGMPFYGIGRLESLVRLDGQPFEAPPAEA
jgi:hypothetical protein